MASYEVSNRDWHGPILVDSETLSEVGRIIDRGPYGIDVVGRLGEKVGSIGRRTMCGCNFTVFDDERPLLALRSIGRPAGSFCRPPIQPGL